MTHAPTILVLASSSGDSHALTLIQAVAAMLPSRCRPVVRVAQPEEFVPDQPPAADVVVLPAFSADHVSALRPVVDCCDEADIPLVRLDDAAAPGALAPRVETLLDRQRTIARLRSELSVAQRFQGGLRGEITRIHEEMQLAAMVQREFLPRALPDLHGLSFAALWRPANYVSGDIYDVVRLDEDHVGVFIADAVGHGVPAALMTMVIARALATKEIIGNSYRIIPPGEALALLNGEMIRRQGETTRFATAAYAVIDCRARTLRMAGAGHPAPLLWREGEGLRPLETSGGLLGVFDGETFDEIDVELHVNDRVLLYSDGFEVAFPNDGADDRGMKLPTKRFLTEFEAISACDTPDAMVGEICRRLDTQRGSLHQNDDLTLLCIKAGELASPASNASGQMQHAAA